MKMSRPRSGGQARRDERALTVLYRSQNQKLYPLSLLVLCIALPLFACLDYYVVGARLGWALRDLFVQVDLGLAGLYVALLAFWYFGPAAVHRQVLPLFLLASHTIILAQLYLMSQVGADANPCILVLLIFAMAILVHLRPAPGVANLIVTAAYAVFLTTGLTPFRVPPDFLSAVFAVTAICAAAVVYRHVLLRQNNEIRRKNRSLARSLGEARELKRRQDGDYFLTSLLIEPLGGNHVSSSLVHVDILTRQKKAFRFRKWNVEIGGDLSTAYRIRLLHRNYAAFLNGDAMGKSIQGAGGALVLGTAFKSIVSRFERPGDKIDRSPEIWLAECFRQIQDVFSSFDGSMMATAMFGLLDEQRGVVYYVNAEHPRMVLYRDGRARYAKADEFVTQKFGMLSGQGSLQINVLQLEPRDVLILGSDGRQDFLLLNSERKNTGILNEDAGIFLNFVEEGRGRLPQILERLLLKGRLADDVSLMSLAYRPHEEAFTHRMPPPGYLHLKQKGKKLMSLGEWAAAVDAFEKALAFKDDDPEIYPYMAAIYRRFRRIKDASRMYETLAWLLPSDTECLFIAAFGVRASYLLDGEVPLARGIDFGERCRLRDRRHIPNLLNLAELYRLGSDFEQARALLDEIQELDPANARARRLSQGLFYRGNLHY